ncbi:hypothetical protein KA005_39710, partial [bacterium]|nr:hypothetical protein [bacterium]
AIAFATSSGVTLLSEALSARSTALSVYIVVGLDGTITEPQAIQQLHNLFPGRVRCFTSGEADTMFHAKIYSFNDRRRQGRFSLLIGSSNLSRAGLVRNREGGFILQLDQGEIHAAREHWEHWWQQLWDSSRRVTANLIADYARDFPRSRRPPAPDRVRGGRREPSISTIQQANELWLQVGLTGGSQNQFEIPLQVVPFFGLNPNNHSIIIPITFIRDTRTWLHNSISYYPHNSMWRLRLDTSIPEVRHQTLRGLFVHFRRSISPNTYHFTVLDSSALRPLRAASRSLGNIGSTSTRVYGWL